MAGVTATLGVILLSGFIAAAAADKVVCDIYAAFGGSATLPLDFKGLKDNHILRWTHNSSVLFYRDRGGVRQGTPRDISTSGSLLLKNLQFSSAGVYEAKVINPPDGTVAKTWLGRLCVQDNVSKPLLSYRCIGAGAISLMCEVAKRQGVEYRWTLDENTLKGEAKETLTMSLAQLNGRRSLRCSVENKVSKERSNVVRPDCEVPPPSLQKAVCIPVKTVAGLMAGAGGVILLLIAALVATCIYYKCNPRVRASLKDKGDVRMLSLNKRELESVGPDYETMNPTENPPAVAPSPKPSPRAVYQSVTPSDGQNGIGALQPTATTEGGQRSPVPKPRTKPLNV